MAAPTKIRILIAFAALYLVWGSTYLGIRFAIETMPPFLMAGSRFLLAGVIMFAIAWSQGAYKASWSNWRVSLIVGACLLLAGNGGVTIAEKYIDSGLAALIVAIVPIYIVILGWATGTAPMPAPIVWLGLVGGFPGLAFCLGQLCVFLQMGDDILRSECQSFSFRHSSGRQDRSIRAARSTRLLRF